MKTTKEHSEKYPWGTDCWGWHLVNNQKLSVIQELMPPNTSEVKHLHKQSQQFFYILKGVAIFEVDGERILVRQSEGIHIQKDKIHQIKNETEGNLEFLVISQPHSHNDKVIVP